LQEIADVATTEEEIPQTLRSRPKLTQFQIPYWQAYQEITGSRQFTSSGVAEIPYLTKVKWLDENEVFDQDERNDFMYMFNLLDSTYLEDFYEKNKVK
jgi:hypothetical protein